MILLYIIAVGALILFNYGANKGDNIQNHLP